MALSDLTYSAVIEADLHGLITDEVYLGGPSEEMERKVLRRMDRLNIPIPRGYTEVKDLSILKDDEYTEYQKCPHFISVAHDFIFSKVNNFRIYDIEYDDDSTYWTLPLVSILSSRRANFLKLRLDITNEEEESLNRLVQIFELTRRIEHLEVDLVVGTYFNTEWRRIIRALSGNHFVALSITYLVPDDTDDEDDAILEKEIKDLIAEFDLPKDTHVTMEEW